MQQPPFGGPPQGYQPTQWPQQQQPPWGQPQQGYPGPGQWPGQAPKKKGNGCLIACIIGGVVLASCGALVAIGAASKSSPKAGSEEVKGSIPASKKEYEGSWVGPGVSLRIQHDGTVNYQKKNGGKNSSINGMKIDRFEDDDFVIDMIFTDTTFKVSSPPTEKDGKWRMTVDGIELTRAGTADDAYDAAASVGCKPKGTGFDCVVTHTGGTTSLRTCWDLEVECKNGTKHTAQACEIVDIGGTKDHAFSEVDVDPSKVCDLKDWNVKNIKLTVP